MEKGLHLREMIEMQVRPPPRERDSGHMEACPACHCHCWCRKCHCYGGFFSFLSCLLCRKSTFTLSDVSIGSIGCLDLFGLLLNVCLFAAAPAVVVVVVVVMWHLRFRLRCQHLRHHGSTSHEVRFRLRYSMGVTKPHFFILFLDLVWLKCAFASLVSSLRGRTIIRPIGRKEAPSKLYGPFSGQSQSPLFEKHPRTPKMGHTKCC